MQATRNLLQRQGIPSVYLKIARLSLAGPHTFLLDMVLSWYSTTQPSVFTRLQSCL